MSEIRHLTVLPDSNRLVACGVPVVSETGLRLYDIETEQWTVPRDGLPADQTVIMSTRHGSDLIAVVFSRENGSGRLAVSHDAGITWPDSIPLPEAADPRCLLIREDSSTSWILGTVNTGLYLSDDLGTTWTQPDTPPDNPGIQCIIADPSHPDHLLTGTRIGIWESNDSGKNWIEITSRLVQNPVFIVDIVAHPRKTGCFLSIFRSETGTASVMITLDGAATWTSVQNGLYADSQPRCIAFHPTRESRLFMGTVYDGVYASDDLGTQWYPINSGLPMNKPIIVHSLNCTGDATAVLRAGTNLDGHAFQLINQ